MVQCHFKFNFIRLLATKEVKLQMVPIMRMVKWLQLRMVVSVSDVLELILQCIIMILAV